MVAKVTEQGLWIPRRLLRGMTQVEIRRGKNRITLVPAPKADPIRKLGRKPVACGLVDASTNHDRYLYSRAAGSRFFWTPATSSRWKRGTIRTMKPRRDTGAAFRAACHRW
jgi:hypothetical protein